MTNNIKDWCNNNEYKKNFDFLYNQLTKVSENIQIIVLRELI